jgi:hypothetical protein
MGINKKIFASYLALKPMQEVSSNHPKAKGLLVV